MTAPPAARRYLVTGAATGIGLAVVKRLLADGARVTGIGLDETEGAREEAAARAAGRDFVFRPVDVTDEDQVTQFFQDVGHDAMHGVVNCAGVYPAAQRLEDVSLGEFRRVLEINLIGTFLVCREALRPLRSGGGGSIVNVSSVHAIAAAPGQAAYAASKAAMVGFTRQIAVDYASDHIRANSILVGSVDTRITRAAIAAAGSASVLSLSYEAGVLGRVADAGEVANVVAFLLGDDSSFITASALLADGGLTSRIL